MTRNFILLWLFAFSFSACDMLAKKDTETETKKKKKIAEEDEEGTKQKRKDPIINEVIETNSDAEILNNIIVHENGGLKISRAFLSFEDGSLVPKTNQTELARTVYLNLKVKSGWKLDDDRMVSIDASEKIASDAGELVLNATNLFEGKHEVKEEDAKHIYLKATITKTREDIHYFVINYLVWDKLGKGEVRGSYRLYINKKTD